MLFASTTASELLASVGTITSDIYTSAYGWLVIAVGLPLSFYILGKLIGLIPKGKR
jgi:hypothetical protein